MNLRREVSDALVARGFRRDDRAHLLRVDDEFSLAVDTGPLNKKPDIAPFVGIRSESVEKLLAKLMELPEDEWIGSLGGNVGYVLNQEYRWWGPPSPASDVLAAIDAALDKLRPFLSLDKLAAAWAFTSKDPAWRYREIVILLLRGLHDAIPEHLEAARAEFCQHQDEVCEQFEQFAGNVRTALKT